MQRIQTILKSERPVKWLFYGDSITHGALHTFGWRDYTEHFTERVRFEMGRSQDVIIKTAISGNTTKDLLRDFDWRVGQFRPHVVFIMIGMNDCATGSGVTPDDFRSNVRELCRRIGALDSALPVLQTTCPILPGTAANREPHIDAYMEIIREVAAAEKVPLVDHTRHWKANMGSLYYWMSDAFHPNNFGHQVFSELLFKEMGIFDQKSMTCRLFHP